MRNTVPWFPFSVIQPVHAAITLLRSRQQCVLVSVDRCIESKYTTWHKALWGKRHMRKLTRQQSFGLPLDLFELSLLFSESLLLCPVQQPLMPDWSLQPSEILDVRLRQNCHISLRSAPPLDRPRPLAAHLPPLDAPGWDWALWQVCFEAPQRNG